MNHIGLILILAAICCTVAYIVLKRGVLPRLSTGEFEANPYERSRTLFSPIHSTLFDQLEKAIDNRYRILGKVRLTDVVDVRADLSQKQRIAALKRLPPSRLDFVICERDSTFILGAVLVDEDNSEPGTQRSLQESALDNFLTTVGIPVARISSRRDYSVEDLRIEISRALFLKWKGDSDSNQMKETGKKGEKDDNTYGICPTCGLPFVKRRARKGTYAGKFFLTCSNYPKCKQVKLIKDKSA